jgi:hypothetical protein
MLIALIVDAIADVEALKATRLKMSEPLAKEVQPGISTQFADSGPGTEGSQ